MLGCSRIVLLGAADEEDEYVTGFLGWLCSRYIRQIRRRATFGPQLPALAPGLQMSRGVASRLGGHSFTKSRVDEIGGHVGEVRKLIGVGVHRGDGVFLR